MQGKTQGEPEAATSAPAPLLPWSQPHPLPLTEPPMLVYQATKREFMDDVEADAITDHITAAFERKLHRANPAEVTSWRNSMEYMYKVP